MLTDSELIDCSSSELYPPEVPAKFRKLEGLKRRYSSSKPPMAAKFSVVKSSDSDADVCVYVGCCEVTCISLGCELTDCNDCDDCDDADGDE